MKERPILFIGPMVRAILDGWKTQTRRLVGLETLKRSETPGYDWTFRGQAPIRSIAQQRRRPGGCWQDLTHDELLALCPYGVAGDRLWVRETWQTTTTPDDGDVSNLVYAADWDGKRPGFCEDEWSWRPSIFMPRWTSRIILKIAEVRVQRLQDISEDDAKAESIRALPLQEADHGAWWTADVATGAALHGRTPLDAYRKLWDALNAKRAPWAENPFVWAISFKRVETT